MIHWLWFKSLLIPCRIRSVRPSNTKTMGFYLKSCYCSDISNAFLPDPSWDIVKRSYIPSILNMQHIMSKIHVSRDLPGSDLSPHGFATQVIPWDVWRLMRECCAFLQWQMSDVWTYPKLVLFSWLGNNETLTLCYKYDVFVWFMIMIDESPFVCFLCYFLLVYLCWFCFFSSSIPRVWRKSL